VRPLGGVDTPRNLNRTDLAQQAMVTGRDSFDSPAGSTGDDAEAADS
jgi:hypothetical protein